MNALIVVDVQEEWSDPKSEYYAGEPEAFVDRINELIDFCRATGSKVIFTRHEEEEGEAFTGPNAELLTGLDRKKGDLVITKHRISPFYRTNLEEELKGVDHVIVAGILTNLCVRSLVEGAYDRDFKVTVVSDCTRSFDTETQEFTLKDLKTTRPEIEIVSLQKFVGE